MTVGSEKHTVLDNLRKGPRVRTALGARVFLRPLLSCVIRILRSYSG
jgi:hypothetical protein